MNIEKDFEELLKLFNKHNVKYCIVGAFALAFHATPRYTKDIDLFLEPHLDNGENAIKALGEFGFSDLQLSAEDFSKPGAIIQLGHEPVRIDLITSLTGCSFDEVWKNKAAGEYGETKVFFIGFDELVKNKKQTGRKQDEVDVESLLKSQQKTRNLTS